MKRTAQLLVTMALCGVVAWSAPPADPAAPSVGQVLDRQLTGAEREIVSLAEAMPADKYSFAPTSGEFKGVRTFGQQASHIAAVLYQVASGIQGEKNPSDTGKDENGPASLKTKQDIVNYMKAAFAYTHKALNTVTDQNATDMVASPFGNNKTARLSLAVTSISHSFDHYGQMVVYLRMNGLVPPASR